MEIKDIIKQLNNEKKIIVEEIEIKNKRLNEIDITLHNLQEIISKSKILCPECNGIGQKFSRSCAEDEGEYKTCHKCKGYGTVNIIS